MAIYLHYFETENDYNQDRFENYLEPWVSLTDENDRVDYNKSEEQKYLEMPFTIEALGSGDISWSLGNKSLQYSKNGGEWTTMTSATTIPVVAGDEVAFKGGNTSYSGCTFSASTADFNVKGNIMSLTDGDNFLTASTLATSYTFNSLFRGCGRLSSAGKLKLPATTLTERCYSSMFYGCTSLTTVPELPATTLASNCYGNMFRNSTSLTTAPELPATTLADNCYNYMFNGCTSLTTAPELPATTLANYCYLCMFSGCTSLIIAPELPATMLMQTCYSHMFDGCTSLTTAPELPATTLVDGCYYCMFQGCTNLNYIKAMFTTTPSSIYTNSWVYHVAATGTFVKNPAATWTTTGDNAVPSGWTIQTASS